MTAYLLQLDRTSGWVEGATWLSSPNHDRRPAGQSPEVLVIHAISLPPGQYTGDAVARFFLNQLDPSAHPYFEKIFDLKVSAHFFIRRDGEIVQFVPVSHRAWHAGESEHRGRANVNDFSIGVELEGTDEEKFATVQYESLSALTGVLIAAFPAITPGNIVGHSDVAPGRKTDPGPGFDWERYRQMI